MPSSPVHRFGRTLTQVSRAIVPDPFVLAIVLTFVVFALAAGLTSTSPGALLRAWQGPHGFWSLLTFGMQMVLILVTGHALAAAPPVRRALRAMAALPGSARQATWLIATVAMTTALLNWGLGLVVGAFLAQVLGTRVRGREDHGRDLYALFCAAGYTGLMCWHGGLSGSAPLMMTERTNVDALSIADVPVLSLADTVFSPLNLTATGGLVLGVPLLAAAMAPAGTPLVSIEEPEHPAHRETTGIGSRTLGILTALLLTAGCVWVIADHGLTSLTPNSLNLLVLTAGIALHGNLRSYVEAAAVATRGTTGILLQFPFYAGIMGVLRDTGLARQMAGALTQIADSQSLAPVVMLTAGALNFLIPSGGGQWAVQGPVALSAASALGVPEQVAVLAVAYGDQLTNMIQPFWALPLLAITGVKASDILGYSSGLMLFGLGWCSLCLTLFTVG